MVALDDTFGAVFIGVIIAASLYGFTCVQTFYYFTHYPSDPWYTKLLVAAALVSDTCHQALITHAVYTYLITNFGVFEMLGNIVWSIIVAVFFNAFTTLFVQCFLAVRIYRLSNKNLLATGSVMIFIIAQFLVAFVFAIKALHFDTFVQLGSLNALSMSINSLAAAGDVLIAALLCSMLHTSRTGFRKSDTLINKLVVLSINTGLLTSVCAVASLISMSAWPHTFIYVTFYWSIGRLYCNSLLATLNARKGLRGESRHDDMSHDFQSRGAHHTTLGTSSKRIPNNISIKIDTTHEYIQDEYSSSSGDMKNREDVELESGI